MTVVNPKSISGITSITTASGSDNLLTIHTSDASNTERFRIDSTGTTKIVTGIVTTLTSSKISLPDSSVGSINVGLGSDLAIYHDGSNSFIKNSTGNLRIQDADGNIQIQAKAGEESIIAKTDGAVELYHNNSKKLETSSTGVTITGGGTFTGDVAVSGANITLQDSGSATDDRIALGAGGDLQLFHDATNSVISNQTGDLYIENDSSSTTEKIYIRPKATENSITCHANGAVELYYDDSKRIETHTQGAAIASGGMTMPTMNSFSSQILVGASGFIGNYHDGTTNQQLIVGTNQYYDSGYKSRTNTTAAQLQFYDRSFRFNTAAAPGSAGGALTQTQVLRIDTDGVKFGTDTASPNALNEYEEGTWTCVPVGFTNLGTIENATYVKIGQVVHIGLNIFQNSNNMEVTSGDYLNGLPFPVAHLSGVFIGGYNNKDVSGAYAVTDGVGNRIILQGAQSDMRHLWTSFTYRTTS